MTLPSWANQKNIVAAVHSAGALLVAVGFMASGQETQVEQAVTVGASALLSLLGAAHNVWNALHGKPSDPVETDTQEPPK